ncbi:hypothetical protein OIDMADRAFT_149202 [Oidiodendron maius Zn]|uniref:WSC domain-containing protein n=1 Tax=Oidiodendron maius (strain Zn) TaxID=913774 RepID=A0A0C3CZH9_OIDMZ|nr:hypothetical protein OIDMADRAFT_149202 [Oidiodendron maius Zn]
MISLRAFITASAAVTLIAGVTAGPVVQRNEEPPQPACTSPFQPFVYAGCFSDPSSPRGLLYDSGLPTQNMTVEICVAFCKGNEYKYAGLEYYGECFCGASVNGVQLPESSCSYPCTGNASEICGGNDIISIYQDPTFPAVDNTTISDYQLLGCYSEGTSGRSLAWRQDQLSTSSLTVEECLFACKDGGYDYAGVEFAQECYCGVVLGNGTTLIDSSTCDMACTGDSSEICGGSSALDLYVATDLGSDQPCGYTSTTTTSTTTTTSSSTSTSSSTTSTTTTSPTTSSTTSTTTSSTTSSSTTSSTTTSSTTTSSTTTSSTTSSSTTTSTTSTTSTSSTTTSCPTTTTSTTTTTSPTTTTTPTSTKTTASLCTKTITETPTPTCEYKCGNWCSHPLPPFNNEGDCLKAVSACSIQVASCFLEAGFPGSLECFEFSQWCESVSSYCGYYCPGNGCSLGGCKSKWPPSGGSPPPYTITTSVYTCTPTTTTQSTTTHKPTTTTCVPVPTCSNICTQPNNPQKGYGTSSPVGGIPIPCLTCNNIQSDYNNGNCFKLYSNSDSSKCPSYQRSGCGQGCKDACDSQYQSCMDNYAQGCKNKNWNGPVTDTYQSASQKCYNQWNDCCSVNQKVSGNGRCNDWNWGW